MLWFGRLPPVAPRADRAERARDEVLDTLLGQALRVVGRPLSDAGEPAEDAVLLGPPPGTAQMVPGARARLRLDDATGDPTLARVDWAAGPPRSAGAPMHRLTAETRRGQCLAVVLLAGQRVYRTGDLRCLLTEALWGGDAVCPLVLHADRIPRARLRALRGADAQAGLGRVRCANPICAARGSAFLLPLHRFPECRMGNLPSLLPALPCPRCPGGQAQAWSLDWVDKATDPIGPGLQVLDYPVKPTVRRTSALPGRMAGTAGAPEVPSWGSVWRPSDVRALPAAATRLRPGAGHKAALRALMQGDGAGVAMAWVVDANNLRALVAHCRRLPKARRRALLPALAHAYQPRRTTAYRTAHDSGEGAGTDHYPYIVYPVQPFFDKLDFFGALEQPGRFLDVGSGVGEKPFLAYAAGAFAACDGIEFNPGTVAVAEYLLAGLRADTPYPVRALQADAFVFDDYAAYDVIYMYRPLRDAPLMGRLLRRIAGRMRVGAICFDAIDARLALRRDAEDAWSTFDPAQPDRAAWTVPVALDRFIDQLGLGPGSPRAA